jgi:hypothetical protein
LPACRKTCIAAARLSQLFLFFLLPVMADNLSNRGPADRSKVNVHETWELTY